MQLKSDNFGYMLKQVHAGLGFLGCRFKKRRRKEPGLAHATPNSHIPPPLAVAAINSCEISLPPP